MKRIFSIGILIALMFDCIIVDGSVVSEKIYEMEENTQIKDFFQKIYYKEIYMKQIKFRNAKIFQRVLVHQAVCRNTIR